MEKTAIEDAEPTAMGGGSVDRRGLSEPLGTTDLALIEDGEMKLECPDCGVRPSA